MNNEIDIAIVGLACRFPGARNADEFWRNLSEGVESITRLSDEELLKSGVPASYLGDPTYVKAAAILEESGLFDAGFFGLSPMEAKTMDPQHRILLELAFEALEHAGYDPDRYDGRIGVFTGSAFNTYFANSGLSNRFAKEYIPTLIGNDKDFLSTRISYKLNLKGPSITVQTACSTSMVAIHLARQSLLSKETDMALAGAMSVRVPSRAGYFCDGGGVVSPDGHVRAFDAKANGTVFGSGGGILVLKRLADALSGGDTIHAVIKGSAVNNDGSEKAGYTAPSVNSQADAIIEALANADVEADSITYIEAHGSGTPVGDPIEIRALTKGFRTSTQRSSYCAIGSVKTNVGHLDAAAGVAGMIKTVLALNHRQIPPSLHFSEANPAIDFPSTPFYVNTRLQEWTSDGPRRAGVMSTGMGGTNAHVILEEAPEPPASAHGRPPYLLIASAKTETALDEVTHRLGGFLSRNVPVSMSDLAYTLQLGRKAFSYRRCLVCADAEDAVTALDAKDSKRVLSSRTGESRRPVVLLLPGIGDQYVGMAHGLYETWPLFRQEVDLCSHILKSHLGVDIRDIIYPGSQSWKRESTSKGIDLRKMLDRKTDGLEGDEARNLNQTQFAQPALFTIEYAMTRLWQSFGIAPDAIIGHSMGEYVAACLAGVLSLGDALQLIATRAKLVGELPQGAMLAVMLHENELVPLLPDDLSISLINGHALCVVAGPVDAVADFERTLNGKGIICRPVQNGHAFHSRMLDPIVKVFEKEVKRVRLNEPAIPYISNVTGTWITRSEATSPVYWAMHANRTARFSDALQQMWQLNNPILLEAGPGRTLGVLALQHPARSREARSAAMSSLRHHYESGSDVDVLLHSVARLWLSGIDIRWENLYQGERRRIPLPTYPFERQHYWLEPVRIPDARPETQVSVHKNPNPSEWVYVPSWKRLLPGRAGILDTPLPTDQPRTWLCFTDECGFASVLSARLKRAGHDVVTVRAGSSFQQVDSHTFVIEPSNFQHYDSLIRALQVNASLPERVVHAWSISARHSVCPKADAFTKAQSLGFYSLLFLAKALAAHNVVHEINVFALSNNTQEVSGTEVLCPEKSTLLGPCMVIPQEYPNLRMKSIDVDVGERVSAHESAADFVLWEFIEPDSNLFVAYRNGQRWVQTYEPVPVDDVVHRSPSFRAGGVYLITGGLGSVGRTISEYLAKNYRARLILVGRTNLTDRQPGNDSLDGSDADSRIRSRTRTLEKIDQLGGRALYLSANVGDIDAMRAAIELGCQRFGALHGVIHGAGIVGDEGYREIKDITLENCEAHFQAKARGLLVLEQVLEGRALDFCLLLSSLTSVLGGLGQAPYASSNIYMDALARKHNRLSSVPWLSVNWDVWRVDDHTPMAVGFGTTLKELGMNAGEATAALENVLAMKTASQLVVSTGDLGARISQWIQLNSLSDRRPAAEAPPIRSAQSGGDEIERRVAGIWKDALGIDEVGIHESFAHLGGHSLLAVGIVNELRKAFQIDLPLRVLFEAPTVAKLSRYIKEHIIAEIETLSEDEAQRLVSNQ